MDPSGGSRKIALAHSKDVAQVHKIGSQSPALWFTQMECLKINLTSLPLQHSHFRGAGSSIKGNGSLRLFSLCTGLRSWSSWPIPRYISSAKTPQGRRRAGRNDVIAQHLQRAGCDRWQRCMPGITGGSTHYMSDVGARNPTISAPRYKQRVDVSPLGC